MASVPKSCGGAMKIGTLVRQTSLDTEERLFYRHGVVIKTQNISRLFYVAWTNGIQGWYYGHDLEVLCK